MEKEEIELIMIIIEMLDEINDRVSMPAYTTDKFKQLKKEAYGFLSKIHSKEQK